MTEELKPCPFCHNVPEPMSSDDGMGGIDFWVIKCIFPPPSDDMPMGSYRPNHYAYASGVTKQDAIKEWNSRPKQIGMENDLLPCPFCGCNEPMMMEHSTETWVVHCKKCHAKSSPHHSEESALGAWNERYCTVLDELGHYPVCLPIIATSDLVKELVKRKETEPYYMGTLEECEIRTGLIDDSIWDTEDRFRGPASILVVRE